MSVFPPLFDRDHSRAVAFAFVSATLIIAHQVAGKATRDTLFLTWFDVTELPKVVVTAAILTVIAVLLVSRLLARYGPARLMPTAFVISAAVFFGEWLLLGPQPRLAAVAVFFHFALFSAILISGFWSVVNERFDPHIAKPIIARVAAAAALGGVLGGVLAERVATLIDLRAMLLVLGAIHIVCAVTVARIGALPKPLARGAVHTMSGLQILMATPYLRRMAILMVLTGIVAALINYALKAEAAARFTSEESLIAFFAGFYAVTGLLTFIVQTFFGRQLLNWLGLGRTIAILPATVAVVGVIATSFTHLWTVVALRAAETVLENSFFRSGFESLYTPLTLEKRRSTKTLIDVGSNRLGDMFGGGLLLAVLSLAPNVQTSVLIGVGVAISMVTLWVVRRLHRGYVEQLADSLRAGPLPAEADLTPALPDGSVIVDREDLLARPGFPASSSQTSSPITERLTEELFVADLASISEEPVSDEDGCETLAAEMSDAMLRSIADLRSGDETRVRRSIRTSSPSPALVAHLIPLLGDPDCVIDALEALRRIGPLVTGQLGDALLDSAHPLAVRRQLPRVLESCGTQRAVDALLDGLSVESFELRYYCWQKLSRMLSTDESLGVSKQRVYAVVRVEVDVSAEVWRSRKLYGDAGIGDAGIGDAGIKAGARADRSVQHVFTLLSLVLDRELTQLALRAVGSDDANLRGTALEYLQNVLPSAIRASLWHHLGVDRVETSQRTNTQLRHDLVESGRLVNPGAGAGGGYPVHERGGYTVIELSGEVDLDVTPRLRQTLLALINDNHSVLVELSAVEFLDSSGVAILVEALRLARNNDLAFGLLGVNDTVGQVLRLARLDQVFDIHDAMPVEPS